MTADARGRGRAAPPRGGAANFSRLASCRARRPWTDFLHRPRERGGAPSPGGGRPGPEGAGRAGAPSCRSRGSAGAGTPSPAALSPRPRTQPRRRHERARPGVASRNCRPLSPPPLTAFFVCLSPLSGRFAARLTADGLAMPGPASPAGGARPGRRRREEGRALTDAVSERPPPGENRDCPRETRPGTSLGTALPLQDPFRAGTLPPSLRGRPPAQLRSGARRPAPPPSALCQDSWGTCSAPWLQQPPMGSAYRGSPVQSSVGKPGQSPGV